MSKQLRRASRRLLLAPVLRGARGFFSLLPWGLAQRLGVGLGWLTYYVAGRDRRRSLDHLAIAFPDMTLAGRKRLSRRSYRHVGMSAAELLHLWGRAPEESLRHVTVEGFEHVEALRRDNRPVLIVTGHCGNWEMISSANLSHGLGLAAMARELDEPGAQGIAVALREHLGSETIARGSRGAARQLLRVVRSGGALALLIDQDLKIDGVFVPFFGRLANTPSVAADMALRLGAAAVPTFSERLEDGSHRVRFHEPVDLPDDPVEATALLTARIEEQIRRRPEQWVWFHRRWRHRPPGEVSN